MPDTPQSADRIEIREHILLARGWGTLSTYDFAYRDSLGHTLTLRREVYDHGHAATVLPFDPVAQTVVLVRQFRLTPHLNQEDGFLLEAPAGLLDGDEPETAVRRESVEETGIDPQELEAVGHIYPSPGSLNEKLYMFLATYRGPITQTRGGLDEEGEDIEIVEMPLAEALALTQNGGIVDAKTIILVQRLALRGA